MLTLGQSSFQIANGFIELAQHLVGGRWGFAGTCYPTGVLLGEHAFLANEVTSQLIMAFTLAGETGHLLDSQDIRPHALGLHHATSTTNAIAISIVNSTAYPQPPLSLTPDLQCRYIVAPRQHPVNTHTNNN